MLTSLKRHIDTANGFQIVLMGSLGSAKVFDEAFFLVVAGVHIFLLSIDSVHFGSFTRYISALLLVNFSKTLSQIQCTHSFFEFA